VQAAGIHHLELTLLFLVLLVAGLTTLAQKFKVPYPIVLFMGGVVLSLFRHLPQIKLNPDVVFLVVLPPLLFIGGFNTSWRDFHKNIVSILMLAFGLVGFTVFGVAVGSAWLIPGFDYRLGAVLGAVVSTTDAIAATAIAKRLGLPRRIVDVLEGESLGGLVITGTVERENIGGWVKSLERAFDLQATEEADQIILRAR